MTTKRAKSLLLAMSIGDGTVRKDSPELQIGHSTKQKDYCEQKAKLLGECLGRNINTHQKTYGRYDCVRFSVSHPYLKFVRTWLYKNNQKTLTIKVLRRLTDEAIAIWYMDDGCLCSKKKNGKYHAFELSISTCCPTIEEAQTICDFFYERYEVKMTIKKMKGRFSVRCGTQNARKLISILEPYCMSGMEYKFKPILEKYGEHLN
jgi:recombination protein RecA